MSADKFALTNSRTKGIILVLTAAILWGISGTVAQFVFQKNHFSPEWLVVIRLLFSGIILLVFAGLKEKRNIIEIWKDKKDVLSLLLFSILGMLAVQYTYFAAIKASNAATATILQYLAPVIITSYLAMRFKKVPTRKEVLAVILALAGTFLLVTHGTIKGLSITRLALFWGLASAFALAFYSIQPQKLLKKFGSTIVVGWGMLIGGICFSFIHSPFNFQGHWSMSASFAVIFIVLFGTLIAFYCYLESLKYINASESSLLACVEPLSAAVLSVIWLRVNFELIDWIGSLCIISTVVILAIADRKESN
ncbi:DMT family transporter [Gottfriedia acidiceleris]|uniref:EamA family transporter n=1 Tax=Gottfriedia acidiceleris TaxID=371036 RepID=A0ABY4JSI6_9BACI|nr:EamA family transporter [Gottfriedia acidiceleris]UPM55788.1 EamA family transporter [Gottfriedia acidiceleris]